MRTINQVANLTAMMFYFALHLGCIFGSVINFFQHNNVTMLVFAVAAVLSYRPYRHAAERSQRGFNTQPESVKRETSKPKPVVTH